MYMRLKISGERERTEFTSHSAQKPLLIPLIRSLCSLKHPSWLSGATEGEVREEEVKKDAKEEKFLCPSQTMPSLAEPCILQTLLYYVEKVSHQFFVTLYFFFQYSYPISNQSIYFKDIKHTPQEKP